MCLPDATSLHQVLLVTGGHGGVEDTTELLLPGASKWTSGPRLPRGMNGLRAINSGGAIFLTGGDNDDNNYSSNEVGHFCGNTRFNSCSIHEHTYLESFLQPNGFCGQNQRLTTYRYANIISFLNIGIALYWSILAFIWTVKAKLLHALKKISLRGGQNSADLCLNLLCFRSTSSMRRTKCGIW